MSSPGDAVASSHGMLDLPEALGSLGSRGTLLALPGASPWIGRHRVTHTSAGQALRLRFADRTREPAAPRSHPPSGDESPRQGAWAAGRPATLETYLALVDHYRAHDPSRTAEGRDTLLKMARWDLGQSRWSLAETRHLSDTYGQQIHTAEDEAEMARGGPLKARRRPTLPPPGAAPALSEAEASLCAAALLHTEVSAPRDRSLSP